MPVLGRGESQIKVSDLVARLGGGHRAVQVRGVHLVLSEAAIARDIATGRGGMVRG
jgi:hypothetical protein